MKTLIGVKIKALRKSLNISQEELSCSILSRTVLSKIENNKILPSIYQLNYLSKVLGVTMEYFIDEEPDIFLDESDENINISIKYLYEKGKYYSIIDYHNKSLIAIKKNPVYLFYIGMSYYKTEFYDTSQKILLKFIKEFDKLHIPEKKSLAEYYAASLNSLSFISNKNNNQKKSISYLIKAKITLESYGLTSVRLYCGLINNLSALYSQTNNFKRSIRDLETFLNNMPELINFMMVAAVHLNLNICYYNLNNYEKSIYHIRSAINLFKYSNNLYKVKHCYLNYTNSLRFSKNYTGAMDVLNYFYKTYSENLEDDLKKSFAMQNIIIHFNNEDYEEVLSLMSNINYVQLEANLRYSFFLMKGHINFVKGEFESAKENLLKCFKFYSESTYLYDLKVIYNELYEITKDEIYSDDNFKVLYSKISPRKNIFVV